MEALKAALGSAWRAFRRLPTKAQWAVGIVAALVILGSLGRPPATSPSANPTASLAAVDRSTSPTAAPTAPPTATPTARPTAVPTPTPVPQPTAVLTGKFVRWEAVDARRGYAYISVTNSGPVAGTAKCTVSVKNDFGNFGFEFLTGVVVQPGETASGRVAIDVGSGSPLINSGTVTDC